MSKGKYLSIFSPQMEAIVSIILQILFATHAILKIGEYYQKFASFKVHLTPKLFFGRDETVQHSHKEFDNFISIWYF